MCVVTTNSQQSIKNWHVSITKNWKTLCFTVRGSNIFKIISLPCIPPSPSRWRITETPCYQYSQGTICIQKITLWSCICSGCISAHYGQYTAGSTRSMYIPRWHTGYWKNSWWTYQEPQCSFNPLTWSQHEIEESKMSILTLKNWIPWSCD